MCRFCVIGLPLLACALTAIGGGSPRNAESVVANPGKVLHWWEAPGYVKTHVTGEDCKAPVFVRVSIPEDAKWRGVVAMCGAPLPDNKTIVFDAFEKRIPKLNEKVHRDYDRLGPGSVSDWYDVTQNLPDDRTLVLCFRAREDVRGLFPGQRDSPLKESAFKVEFSRTEDAKGIFGVAERKGPGDAISVLVARTEGFAWSDADCSAVDLKFARAAAHDGAETRPRRFYVGLGKAQMGLRTCSYAALRNVAETYRLLGFNDFGSLEDDFARLVFPEGSRAPDMINRNPGGALSPSARHLCRGHLCSPDYASITNMAGKYAAGLGEAFSGGRKVVVNVADEPGVALKALTNCASTVKTCRERFRDYLAANGVEPFDFCLDHSDPKAFYWTVRYRNKLVVDAWKAVADAVAAVNPNLLVTANVGIELIFSGNMLSGGMDPFALLESGAFRIGTTEDWSSLQPTCETCSYVCDVWRAAATRAGRSFYILSVIKEDPSLTGAKAFSEVGHGAMGIEFFAWGPNWLGGGDSRNQCHAMYPALREFTAAVRRTEDDLVRSRVAKGDAALILSRTGDICTLTGESAATRVGAEDRKAKPFQYGKDRLALSILLKHCNVRTDIVEESDIATALKDYKVAFVTDRNMRRECAKALGAWMKAGGVLVKSPEALTADEYERPFASNAWTRVGRTVELGFAPWKDYLEWSHGPGGWMTKRDFPVEIRTRMRGVLAETGVRPRLATDNPLVEASLLEAGDKRLVVVANWTLKPRTVKITLDGRTFERFVNFGDIFVIGK